MKLKVLIITYYWPPSGGSGVQRWMYFAKYLPEFGVEPFVITVDEKYASYKFKDLTFAEKVKDVKVFTTKTREPLKLYSKIRGGGAEKNIPMGFAGESDPTLFQKFSRYIRGNFFIPDARVGWNKYAFEKAKEVIALHDIKLIITTGPPHSTHLVGLKLKEELGIKWIADLRDPWLEVYYNKFMYRSKSTVEKDRKLEQKVLLGADKVLTIGPSMKKMLDNKLKIAKTDFIYNGFDSELFSSIKKNRDNSQFTICHIGILSESQPITSFLNAISIIHKTNEEIARYLRLQFVGKVSPAILNEVKQKLPWAKLEVVNYVSHQEAITYMMNADLLLNSFADTPDSALLVSGKLMEYIATGNPIVGLGHPEGDAAALLKELEDAEVFDRKEVDKIGRFVLKIFEKRNNKGNIATPAVSKYSRYETTRQLAELLNKMK